MAGIDLLNENTAELKAVSVSIRRFLEELLDEASFVETDVFLSGQNAVYDSVPLGEGVVTGYGSIGGYPVYVAAQNSEVFKGGLGKAHAEKILRCIERAKKNNLPLISVIDSAGVRIGEGLAALDASAKIIRAVNDLRYYTHHISIIKGTSAGLTSVFAEMSDFIFMSEAASLSVNPPMALAAAAGTDKKAADILGAKIHTEKSGLAAFGYKDAAELKNTISRLFEYLDEELVDNSDDPNRVADGLNAKIDGEALLAALADDGKYLEVYKNFCPEVRTVFSSVNSLPVGIVVTNATENARQLTAKAIKKINRFIKILSKYDITLINLVDCDGIKFTLEEEAQGASRAVSALFRTVAEADINKISVITGSAVGAAYTALCSKGLGYDYVIAFPDAKLSPMTAEAAVSFLYRGEMDSAADTAAAKDALIAKYRQEESNPFISAKDGGVDNIIEPALLRPYVASVLTMSAR